MAENITAEPSLSYKTSGYVDYGESIDDNCLKVPVRFIVIVAVCMGICLCGLVGNGTVIWFLGCQVKQNPFTIYILNLAIADFSLLLFLLVKLTVSIMETVHCVFSVELFLADYIMITLFQFWYFASIFLLTAINMERCLSVLFPVWYRCRRPKHLSGIVCGVLWALAGLWGSLVFIRCRFDVSCEQIVQSLIIFNILLFFFFQLLSNLSLFIKLCCGSQRRHPGRIYIAILLSVIFMFIFGLPFSVVVFLDPLFVHELHLYISCLLTSLNSSINPVIYVLVGSCQRCQLQCSVKVAFRQLFEEKAMTEERSSMPREDVVESSV